MNPVALARELMDAYAVRTGLAGDLARAATAPLGSAASALRRRYLWTDAFAVCNYLGLARATGERTHLASARRLVDAVHAVLGRHRPDDPRTGWLSGLDEATGALHPTAGGLRIGKPRSERGPDEPYEPRAEWDRDGQYFHYLTKWMHALDLLARGLRDRGAWQAARELASAAHRGFVTRDRGRPRLVWKASIDLSRPLVASMGQHDPLDGVVTCAQIEETGRLLGADADCRSLAALSADFAAMLDCARLATDDPLGIGGLLLDAARIAQLASREAFDHPELLEEVVAAALTGLAYFRRRGELEAPAGARLAFRELGLAIGLAAVDRSIVGDAILRAQRHALDQHRHVAHEIVAFWVEPAHRRVASWTEHFDIDDVMLATALLPEGCARLPTGPG
jgi:hypothetical protein